VEWAHESDAASIAHLARLEDQAAELSEQLAREGLTYRKPVVSPRGEVVGEELLPSPCIKALRELDSRLIELRAALGLDPRSRARLGLELVEAHESRRDFVDILRDQVRARRAGEMEEYELLQKELEVYKARNSCTSRNGAP
jgi:hypothetical protein